MSQNLHRYMKVYAKKYIGCLALLVSLSACQRQWTASPSLAATDVPVNKTVAADSTMEARIQPYRQEVTKKMSEVVGVAPVALNKGNYDSPIGNFVVDLQMEQAKPVYGKSIDLSLTTDGGLRVPLPAGNITTGNIFELMPFENELVVLTLKGETVKQLFDYAAKTKTAPIGNATYTVKGGIAADVVIAGEPLALNRTYTLVTSDYLAGGGDNMSMLKENIAYERLGLLLRDAILKQIKEFTAAGKPVTADTTARVNILP